MPKTCCSCHDDSHSYPLSSDTCMCGCAYLNGWVAIIGVQLLALIGMLFSLATLADCSFVELDERLFFPADLDEDLPLKVTQTQYVGFLTWRMLDGNCYYYTSGANPNDQLLDFQEILGRDWEMARIVAMLNACLSFLFVCYLLSFTCSSQVRGVRYFNTVFLSLVLTGLQGITFLSFGSSFCKEYGCTFSRSAGLSAASMGCFFLSGLCFCCTTDYPGPRSNKKKPILMATAQIAPVEQIRKTEPRLSVERSQRQSEARSSYIYEEEIEPEIEEIMQDYEDEVIVDDDGEEIVDDDGEEIVDEHEEEIVDDDGEDVTEEYIVEDEDGNEVTNETEQIPINDSDDSDDDSDGFEDHPDLAAGEDVEVFTEVTEEEVTVVETVTHTDGSQTVTKTVEEVADENRAEV